MEKINIGDKVYCVFDLGDDELSYESELVVGIGADGFWISGTADNDPHEAYYVGSDEIGEEIFLSEHEAYEAIQAAIQDKVCDAYEAAKDEGKFR